MPPIPTYANEGMTPSGIPFSELESRVDALVAGHIGKTSPGAAIAVVSEGEIIFSKGYGHADIDKGILVDPAVTKFGYASVGKLFVWVSAMQLVEQGRLDLDADITNYLPEDFSRRLNNKNPITMRGLMNHNAGLEGSSGIGMGALDSQVVSGPLSLRDALLMMNPSSRQIFEPGTVSSYSNYGSALAAYVVAQIAGQEYYKHEREKVLNPVGMDKALSQPAWLDNQDFLKSRAVPYLPDGKGGFNVQQWGYITIYPAGTLAGTVEELARFAIALTPPAGETGPLFTDPDSLARIFTPSSLDPVNYPGTHHGFWRYSGVAPAFGHAGHGNHYTNFVVVPETRFGFVVSVNGNDDIVAGVTKLLLGNTPLNPQPGNKPSTVLVEGSYQLAQGLFKSNFLKMNNYFTPRDTVTAIDSYTIELKTGMYGPAKYQQVEPFVYQITSWEHPGMAVYFSTLRFKIEDGRPVQIHVGDGKDFVYLPQNPISFVAIAGAAVSILYLLISPLVLLIAFFVNRKKDIPRTRFNLLGNCFLLSGTLLVLNNVTLAFITNAGFHVWLNYIIAAASVSFFIASFLTLRKEEIKKKRKVIFIVTSVLNAVMLFVLASANFFLPV